MQRDDGEIDGKVVFPSAYYKSTIFTEYYSHSSRVSFLLTIVVASFFLSGGGLGEGEQGQKKIWEKRPFCVAPFTGR